MAEIQRLVRTLAAEPAQRQHRLHWSAWRRAHQATARRGHEARRARQHHEVPVQTPAVIPVVGTPLLTEALWSRLLLILPPPAKRGRPRGDARAIVTGLLWLMHTGAGWREIPPEHGPWHTLYSRYQLWRRTGTGAQISAMLRDHTDRHASN